MTTLLIPYENAIFCFKHGHIKLIDPAPLQNLTSVSYLGSDEAVEVGGSILNKYVEYNYKV